MEHSWLEILAVFVIPAAIICSLVVLTVLLIKYYKQQRMMKRYNEFLLLIRIRKLYKDILVESLDPSKLQARVAKKRGVVKSLRRKPVSKRKSIVLNEKVSIVPADLRIKFDQLDMGMVLGQGAFGRVYQAVLKDSPPGSQRTVAVKTIQDTSDPRNIIKFLEEGLLMKTFDHPNVLGLLGLTFDPQDQPLIVLPFMPHGDLKSFLENPKQEITNTLLIRFAYHVALGMEYLGQQEFVHRDLAARNCMVDDELVAKIADFGLSRDLDESDYYTSGDKQAKMPIKWMAPESMERMVYSTRTDVWSYGVLLWELFSRGKRPYPGLHNSDVYTYLKQGLRMDPPKFCPKKISAIMQDCWKDSPKMRCSFKQIVEKLDDLMAGTSDGLVLPSSPRSLSAGPSSPPVRSESSARGTGSTPSAGLEHAYVNLPVSGAAREESGSEGPRGSCTTAAVVESLGGKPRQGDKRQHEDADRGSCSIAMVALASGGEDKGDTLDQVSQGSFKSGHNNDGYLTTEA